MRSHLGARWSYLRSAATITLMARQTDDRAFPVRSNDRLNRTALFIFTYFSSIIAPERLHLFPFAPHSNWSPINNNNHIVAVWCFFISFCQDIKERNTFSLSNTAVFQTASHTKYARLCSSTQLFQLKETFNLMQCILEMWTLKNLL